MPGMLSGTWLRIASQLFCRGFFSSVKLQFRMSVPSIQRTPEARRFMHCTWANITALSSPTNDMYTACILCIRVYIYICMYICICIYVFVYVYTDRYFVCLHTHIDTHTHIYIYVCVHIYTCTHTYVTLHTCVAIFVYIYICTHNDRR